MQGGEGVRHRLIGEGAFATVRYFAKNQSTGKEYVMKVGKDEASRAALAVERRLLLSLSHRNVVKAVPCDMPRYKDNLVMEKMYCDLHHYINTRARTGSFIPETVLRTIMGEVLSGLSYLHSHGIAHRDIKPENILLGTKSTEVVLCDFGTALQFGKTTRDYNICGTALYQAPELLDLDVLRNGRVGEMIAMPDMFSVGVAMLVSHTASLPPHQSEHRQSERVALMLKQCRRQVPEPRLIFDDASSTEDGEDGSLSSSCEEGGAEVEKVEGGAGGAKGPLLSEPAFEVLKGLLKVDPAERLSASQALQLSWFQTPQLK